MSSGAIELRIVFRFTHFCLFPLRANNTSSFNQFLVLVAGLFFFMQEEYAAKLPPRNTKAIKTTEKEANRISLNNEQSLGN